MAKYDDLTPAQRRALTRFVERSRETGDETFVLLMGGKGALALGTSHHTRLEDVPDHEGFYATLGNLDYAQVLLGDSVSITLLQRAFDAVAYWDKGGFRRFWVDLAHDLAHNTTLRSRLFWAAGTVLVNQLVTSALIRLGVL